MKRLKKLTAAALGVVMAFSVTSFSAFADENLNDDTVISDTDGEPDDDAITDNKLNGEDGISPTSLDDGTEKMSLEALETESDIQGADQKQKLSNVVFASGKNVTVAPSGDNGLIVTIDDTEYIYENNSASVSDGALTIFAGGKDDSETYSNVKITIMDGAKVNSVYGGGYNDSEVENVKIVIEEGAVSANVYGGGMTSYGNDTDEAKVGESVIEINGKVNLIYAGGNAAVGVSRDDVISFDTDTPANTTANNYVGSSDVTINGTVGQYFGGSYSYGGVGKVNCEVYGEITGRGGSNNHSAVTGTNGFRGAATMTVHKDAEISAELYMSMRGYIGDTTLNNYGTIKRVSLNPDGDSGSNKGEASYGNVTVNNYDNGVIENCNIDCGCNKTGFANISAYPAKITVSGDVEVTSAFWESNTGSSYTAVEGQTIYLKDGATLKEAGTLSNVKIVAEEVGDTTVTVEPDVPKVEVPTEVTLPDNFTSETIKSNTEVEGLGKNVSGIVTNSDVEKAKEELASEISSGNDVVIEVKPYLDITVVDYKADTTEKKFTVDITPKCVVKAKAGSSEVQLKDEVMEVKEEVVVTIPVPADVFAAENLFVKHVHGNHTYYYEAELKDNKVTFTNPNGFSEMTVFNDSREGTIIYKDEDGSTYERKYDVSKIGNNLEDYSEKGYIFNGWIIEGKTYTTMTDELLTLINGKEVKAKADLTKKKTSSGSSYSLEEGKVSKKDKDDKDEPVVTPEEKGPFYDVSTSDPNYDAIIKVYEKGWMVGVSDGVFAANGTLTRGMAATILWNKAGKPEPVNVSPFLDVTGDAYYAKAVAWAYEQGIVLGYDGTTFGPNDFVTTEQFTIMLDKSNGNTPAVYVGGAPNATRGWVAGMIA
ncbi:MAG: S-layer homology domain-containing protein [Candidatus Metalachnospira sp.]|nr:S-layer homology domain-containing protein [Candidatus Metalachnospira sp.]